MKSCGIFSFLWISALRDVVVGGGCCHPERRGPMNTTPVVGVRGRNSTHWIKVAISMLGLDGPEEAP